MNHKLKCKRDNIIGAVLALLLLVLPFVGALSQKNDIVLLLLFAGVGFLLLFLLRAEKLKIPYAVFFLLAATLFYGFSSLHSVNVSSSIFFSVEIFALFLIFILIFNLKDVGAILRAGIMISGLAGALWGLFKAWQGSLPVSEPWGWYNQTAGFLLFPSFLLLGKIFELLTEKKRQGQALQLQKPFSFVVAPLVGTVSAFIIVSAAFFLTHSRASYVSLAGGLAVFFFFWLKRRASPSPRLRRASKSPQQQESEGLNSRRWFIGGAVMFLMVVFAFLLFGRRGLVRERIWDVSKQANSLSYRIALFEKAVEIGRDHIWTGTGPGTFYRAYQVYQDTPWLYSKYTHNFFLQSFAEAGLVGILLWVAFFGVFFWGLGKEEGKEGIEGKEGGEGNWDIVEISLLAGVVASLLHNLVDLDWSAPGIFFLFIVFLALLAKRMRAPFLELKLSKILRRTIISGLTLVFFFGLALFFSRTAKKLADYYNKTHQNEKAQQYYSYCTALTPFSAPCHSGLAIGYYEQGDLEAARKALLKTVALDPWSSLPYVRLGELAEKQGRHEEAEKYYRKAVALFKYTYPKNYRYLAEFYRRRGDEAGMMWIGEVFPERYPLNKAYENYKFIYAGRGALLDMAVVYKILAGAYQEQGQQEKAEVFNQRVVKLFQDQQELAPGWLQ